MKILTSRIQFGVLLIIEEKLYILITWMFGIKANYSEKITDNLLGINLNRERQYLSF